VTSERNDGQACRLHRAGDDGASHVHQCPQEGLSANRLRYRPGRGGAVARAGRGGGRLATSAGGAERLRHHLAAELPGRRISLPGRRRRPGRRPAGQAAEKGIRMLDCPVAKTSDAAVTGTLTIMVGGERATMDEALPVLQTMGTDIFYCGPIGSGHAMKLVNNLISTNLMALNAEALVLGAKCGLTVETMLEVMSSTAATNGQLVRTMRNRVLAGDENPGFMARLAHKDLGLIIQLGYQLGVSLPITALIREQFSEVVAEGLGNKDLSTVLKIKEHQAKVRVRLAEAGGITPLEEGAPQR